MGVVGTYLAEGTANEAAIASAVLFYLFGGIAAGGALGVVISRNIVRTAVFLLITLLGVAGLYFLLAAEFLAAVQLVVYAGGTLILIIFGVMLTSKSPFSRFEPKVAEVVIALSLGAVLFGSLVMAITRTKFPSDAMDVSGTYPLVGLGAALLGDYLVPFELSSVLLLVVMIGAAYLAKGRRREGEGTPTPSGEPAITEMSRRARQWT